MLEGLSARLSESAGRNALFVQPPEKNKRGSSFFICTIYILSTSHATG